MEKINKVSYISPSRPLWKWSWSSITPQHPDRWNGCLGDIALPTHFRLPYASGKTRYYETRTITTKGQRPVVSSNLLNYAND